MSDAFDAKLIRVYSRQLRGGEAVLRKHLWFSRIFLLAGGVLSGMTLASVFQRANSAVFLYSLAAFFGGLVIGTSLIYSSSIRHWRVLSGFLHTDAVHDAARRSEDSVL